MCVYMSIYMNLCVCVCVSVYMYVYVYESVCMCICVSIHINVCVQSHFAFLRLAFYSFAFCVGKPFPHIFASYYVHCMYLIKSLPCR